MALIILDRDGVINQDSDEYIKSPEEFIPLPGSLEAIAQLNRAGYKVAVASNQSGIARGLFDLDTLQLIHTKLHRLLTAQGGHIDLILFCPHGPDDNCNCRKPKPGLLLDIQKYFHADLSQTPVVGDSLRDLQAAQAVGAKPILVKTGNGQLTLKDNLPQDITVFNDLAAYVQHLSHKE